MQHHRTKDFKTSSASGTSLVELESELAVYFGALAVMAQDCYGTDAGLRMLGQQDQHAICVDDIDVRRTIIGEMLPVFHAYAFNGILVAGAHLHFFEEVDGPFARLVDMVGLLNTRNDYFEDCINAAGGDSSTFQHKLVELTKRCEARFALDKGHKLSVVELALLAEMQERSVRNAVSASGAGRLELDSDGNVSNEEANRWLSLRRGGFHFTKRREIQFDSDALQDDLLAVELPHFVSRRIMALYPNEADPMLAAGAHGPVRSARLQEMARLPLSIQPHECAALATTLKVDPVWLTVQVMHALFPDQVDMLLNPGGWRAAATDPTPLTHTPMSTVQVILTKPMLAHGYLDLPMSASEMFPSDCFAGREAHDDGETNPAHPIEITFGTHAAATDMRIKSAVTISPRRRFSAWFNRELRAQPGDRIVVQRLSERIFSLTYQSTVA